MKPRTRKQGLACLIDKGATLPEEEILSPVPFSLKGYSMLMCLSNYINRWYRYLHLVSSLILLSFLGMPRCFDLKLAGKGACNLGGRGEED